MSPSNSQPQKWQVFDRMIRQRKRNTLPEFFNGYLIILPEKDSTILLILECLPEHLPKGGY